MNKDKTLVTQSEYARLCGVSRQAISNRLKNGNLELEDGKINMSNFPLKKGSLGNEELMDRYNKLIDYQKEVYPFIPKVREIQKVWNTKSTGAVVYILNKLVDMGKVRKRSVGNRKNEYYAI